jgi:hypothetical protein
MELKLKPVLVQRDGKWNLDIYEVGESPRSGDAWVFDDAEAFIRAIIDPLRSK